MEKQGTSLCTLLTVSFVTLKLCHVIEWSWWWVLSPVWGPFALCAGFFGILGAIYGTALVVRKIAGRSVKSHG